MMTKVKNIYPSIFNEFLGKKIKLKYIARADKDEDGNLSLAVSWTVGDPLRVHFLLDGTIINFSGGGQVLTIERHGEIKTEYCFFDLDRRCVRDEIKAFIE